MYHVSAQGIDERMINVHYYYYAVSEYSRSLGGVSSHSIPSCACATFSRVDACNERVSDHRPYGASRPQRGMRP